MSSVHPWLQARNFSRLRPYLRTNASKAMGGSTRHIAMVCAVLPTLTEDEVALIFPPVIYANLDPARMPSPEVLDGLTNMSAQLPCIQNLVPISEWLKIITAGPLFDRLYGAAPDLWARFWPWVDFLLSHEDSVVGYSPEDELLFHQSTSQTALALYANPITNHLVAETPGIRRAMAISWIKILRLLESDEQTRMRDLGVPISVMADLQNRQHLAEVIDGCGGDLSLLSRIMAETITLASRHPTEQAAGALIGPILLLLQHISSRWPATLSGLMSNKLVSALVSALAIQMKAPGHQPVGIQLCLSTLLQFLHMPQAFNWIIASLRKGLLTQVVFWGEKLGGTAPADTVNTFDELMQVVLPEMLIRPSIIVEMKRRFDALEERAAQPAFADCVLYPMWAALRDLVNRRAALVKDWEDPQRQSSFVCHNVQCAKVANRDSLRRCGGCHTAVYCSETCQRADWVEVEGHRTECKPLFEVYQGLAVMGIHHREKSFIRTLLDMECREHRVRICIEVVRFMAQNPGTPCVLAFNYENVLGTKMIVLPLQTTLITHLVKPTLLRMHRELLLLRAPMPLHVVCVRYGTQLCTARSPRSPRSPRCAGPTHTVANASLGSPNASILWTHSSPVNGKRGGFINEDKGDRTVLHQLRG
ncbi:hypothetical protein FB45DRAFT_1126627 [Roridomyces roridus]|uniref:MYND-type domain-containing protein n=1 Tax=Roridomyces roridus TaxID=1738132 RepID=A0AAD7C930_9AGAR|nr:hypothetical protein FB45DRAFT_1126627 [Roridomyces roridus]